VKTAVFPDAKETGSIMENVILKCIEADIEPKLTERRIKS